MLYTLLSLGAGAAGIMFVLWRKAIVEKKLAGAETGLASLHETLALARDEIARQRVAAVKTQGNYEHEITLYKAQIATLEKQRASAIEALERAGAPGALRGLLRDKLGLPAA